MKLLISSLFVFSSLVAAACSSSTDSSGGGSGTYSCDTNVSGSHGCTDYEWSGGAYSTSSFASACSSEMGTPGTSCSHTGAVGGCELKTTSGTVSVTTTSWFYSGTADTLKMACSGTWVSP